MRPHFTNYANYGKIRQQLLRRYYQNIQLIYRRVLTSNLTYIRNDKDLLVSQVSERSLCETLMLHLNRTILYSKEFE